MAKSYSKIWIHALFGTKDLLPLINETLEPVLYRFIKKELEESFNTKIKIINGIENHTHALFLLNPNYAITEILKTMKAGSSYWINHNNLTDSKFSWEAGYSAYSVSESNVGNVEKFIKNQKSHHKKISFKEEYQLLINKHGLIYENR
ncbi:MAG: transposase [Ignavibacteria bacterium]|nr:transposase [Ignavibacteria bacterium]